jgi:hypothetical protein
MTTPYIPLDGGPSSTRSVVFPDWLWERLRDATEAESRNIGYQLSISDLVRQGAAQRVDAILGKQDAA